MERQLQSLLNRPSSLDERGKSVLALIAAYELSKEQQEDLLGNLEVDLVVKIGELRQAPGKLDLRHVVKIRFLGDIDPFVFAKVSGSFLVVELVCRCLA